MHDAILIGAGHNALVCAHSLAKAGWRVLVLESRDVVGGCCVTEELWPGYRVSTAAYVVSLLLPEIEQEVELARHGYEVLPRNPSSFTPLEDGRYLLLGPDDALNQREIGKFSASDARAYPEYERLLTRVASCLEPTLSRKPVDLFPWSTHWRRRSVGEQLRDLWQGWTLRRGLQRLEDDLPQVFELLTGSAMALLDRWFESDVLKGVLATDAIIGTFQPPSAPGTAYVLLHHVMGQTNGARGVWGYVRGGMGSLTGAMAAALKAQGGEIRTGCPVSEILTCDGRAVGVKLANGEECYAARVVSGVDARRTFTGLLPQDTKLPTGFREAVDRLDYASASLKINLAVRELPDFLCLPGRTAAGPHHRGTIHINATPELIEQAYAEARSGEPSQRPIIELTIPTAVDPSLAPPGQHILSLFVQYAPYRLAHGCWDDRKEAFADRCLEEIARFAPNVPSAVLHRQVLSPVDLERTFGLTGGNIFQGAMPLHQLFNLRPLPGWSDYRTPVNGLYLCGAATHPGGGVMGACGRNAACEMLRDGKG